MNKRNKLLTAIIAGCLSLAIVGVGTFAYFTTNKADTNTMTSGSVSIELKEDFPEHDEYGADTTSKTFWGVATGSKKSIARASIFVSVEYKNPESGAWEVLGSIPSNAVTFDISDATRASWLEGNDGYWYYQTVLEGNPDGTASDTYVANDYTTSKFEITNVAISGDEYLEIASQYTTRINMLVTIETCQATNGAYTLSWENCDTSKLPAGVVVNN